jgi:hypothetical protein
MASCRHSFLDVVDSIPDFSRLLGNDPLLFLQDV